MSNFNVDLMRKVVHAVEEGARNGQWDQKDYVGINECGTTYCTAGFAVALSGKYTLASGLFFELNGEYIDTFDAAVDLLGITPFEADTMFYNTETTDPNDVRIWAKEVAANHGVDL